MKKTNFTFIALLSALSLYAQIHVSGSVTLSVKNGTIACDLELSNIPKLDSFSIMLNAGLNVRYFRQANDKANYAAEKFYESKNSDEAFQYVILNKEQNGVYLPDAFKINYVGAFPVHDDSTKASIRGDWKGNMAFNGQSARFSEQSTWYPVIYDAKNDVFLNKVTYDLTVKCADCDAIYLNGSDPVQGKTAHFQSKDALAMLLFAGKFAFSKTGDTYFVNPTINAKQQAVFNDWISRVTKFYENKLGIPYGKKPTFLETKPVTLRNSWAFVTNPTIVVISRDKRYTLQGAITENGDALKDTSSIAYYAHELGHYYFGTVVVPNSSLRWFFLEGTTEYLALQATRHVLGEKFYQAKLKEYAAEIKNMKVPSLATIKDGNDISEAYRYNYEPLLLTALEKEIGIENVWKWLSLMLKSEKNVPTDYTFFKKTLLQSGVSETTFSKFENEYILDAHAKDNVLKTVNQK